MKIQSIGDLITNSSTEVFTIIDSGTIDTIKEIVSTLAGPEVLEKIDIKLDYCEMIQENIDEIIDYFADIKDVNLRKLENKDDEDDENDERIAYRLIATYIDKDIIENHFVSPFRYRHWDVQSKEYVHDEEVEPYNTEDLNGVTAESFMEDIVESINDGREWKYYPSVVAIVKDKDDEKAKAVAGVIPNLPFICDHEASYC